MGKFGQPNENEKAFFEAINDITQICQYHLQEEFGPSPFCYKQIEYFDKKKRQRKTKKDDTTAPVLYAKHIYSEKTNKILSLFTTK